MMATLAASTETYERLRRNAVEAYMRAYSSMWGSLSPSDWWNDGVALGAAAYMGLWDMRMVRQVRQAAISYADATLDAAGIKPPKGYDPTFIYPRFGTDPWEVNYRPAQAYRSAAIQAPSIRPVEWPKVSDADWRAVSEWLEAASEQGRRTADTNATLAGTDTTLTRYRRAKVLSYRRVLHPEMSKTGCCGLCVVAATRWYSTASLLPLHSHCHCTVAPAGSEHDPGLELNEKDLQRLYSEAGGTTGERLRGVSVRFETNGEIGPVMSYKDAKAEADGSNAEWQRPTMQYTLEQYKRMKTRAQAFDAAYEKVLRTGKNHTFRVDGRTYTFKPSGNLNKARAYTNRLVREINSQLAKAA